MTIERPDCTSCLESALADIDSQHCHLVSLINDLRTLQIDGDRATPVRAALDELCRHLLPRMQATDCPTPGSDAKHTGQPLAAAPSELLEVNRLLHAELEQRRRVEQQLATANENLAARETLLKQILDTSSVAIFLVDKSGYITHANRCMAEMFGYPRAALETKEYIDLLHPAERDSGRQKMQALLDSHFEAVDLERRYWRADQTEFLGHLTGKRFYDARGQESGLVGVIVDISERRRAELALKKSEASFRRFFEENGSVMLLIDLVSGQIMLANQAASSYYGYPLKRLIGMSIDQINTLPPAEVALQRQRVQDGEQKYFNFRHRLASGEVRDVEVYSAPTDVAGQPLIFSIVHDITDRKKAQERLQLTACVFSHAREGIIITDANATIVEVNDTFTGITGYRRDEVIGQNPRLLQSGLQAADYYSKMWDDLLTNGYWSGEIWNKKKSGELYAEMLTISAITDANGNAKNYVALFTDITPVKQYQQRLESLAHYDPLTALPNRVLLAEHLQKAIAHSKRCGQALAVLYLDLDGFKSINDRYGHHTGDELLIAVTNQMQAVMRDGDTLARLGGDEFVAVLTGLDQSQHYEPILIRLLQAAANPLAVRQHQLQVSASIGITLYPDDNSDADQLIRHADQAMYIAKQAGKNRYHLFDVGHDTALKTQQQSIEHIRQALDRREFVLYYQPKVNMKTRAVVGAEALLRWQQPERGLLLPAAFLPAIENHPISIELGEWVIDTALAQMAQWAKAGHDFPVSVNVSARQLQQHDFVARIAALLAAHRQVEPGSLELEILETSALEDITQVSQTMHACRALGVQFALDDFGTGYSSLSYLKRLPAGLLKIDQGFVRDMLDDPEDLAIIQAVVSLAAAFRRQVIAEGVETTAHGQQLLAIGCELAQGYGIARPMPASALPGWATHWRSDRGGDN